MTTEMTPQEIRRLHQAAERTARCLRREAVRDFPQAGLRRLCRALLAAARGAVQPLRTRLFRARTTLSRS